MISESVFLIFNFLTKSQQIFDIYKKKYIFIYKYYKYLLFYNINMGRLRNKIANTLGIAPRTVKTAARTTIDTTKSALNVILDPFIGL